MYLTLSIAIQHSLLFMTASGHRIQSVLSKNLTAVAERDSAPNPPANENHPLMKIQRRPGAFTQ